MAEKITIDFEILKNIFSEINALKGQFLSIGQVVGTVEKSVVAGFSDMEEAIKEAGASAGGTENTLHRIGATDLSSIANSFRDIGARITEASQPGIAFQTSLADLSAITGVVGEDLDNMGEDARAMAKDLGGDAAQSVEAMKLVLSQLTPELAKSPAALSEMTREAILLGKTMKGDTAGAMEVLTTVMNQFGIDTKNPIAAQKEMVRISNLMAAAAKEGSAELPALKAGMMEVGGIASRTSVSIEETAAALEVLDKKGLKASEGGHALKNVLTILASAPTLEPKKLDILKAAGVDIAGLADKSKTLKERLELLGPIQNDTAAMAEVFGRENLLGATALAGMTDLLGEYTTKVTGTNVAHEQAAIVMDTFAERASRTSAWFKDLGISLFNVTEGILPFMEAGFSGVSMLADLGNAHKGLVAIMNTGLLTSLRAGFVAMRSMSVAQMFQATTTGIVTGATALFNAVLAVNPIVWVIGLIGGLVAALIYAWNNFEGFRAFLFGLWESTKVVFQGIWEVVKVAFSGIVEAAKGLALILQGVWELDFDKVTSGFAQFGKGIVDNITAPFRAVGEAVNQAEDMGEKVGVAYARGNDAGIASFRADEAEKAQEEVAENTRAKDDATARSAMAGWTPKDAAALFGATPTTEELAGAPPMAETTDALKVTPEHKKTAAHLVGGDEKKHHKAKEGEGVTVGGGHAGEGKNISMNITMNMQFPIGKDVSRDVRSIAEEVVAMITGRLNDAQFSMG